MIHAHGFLGAETHSEQRSEIAAAAKKCVAARWLLTSTFPSIERPTQLSKEAFI